MYGWLAALLLVSAASAASATPWYGSIGLGAGVGPTGPGSASGGGYQQPQSPPMPPPSPAPPAGTTPPVSMCSSSLQQHPQQQHAGSGLPWLQSEVGLPRYPPTAPGPSDGAEAPRRSTRTAQGVVPAGPEPGVAYMVGIYMQPVRLPGHNDHAPRQQVDVELEEDVRGVGAEGLSLLDDNLLQQLGDILTQYDEEKSDDDGLPPVRVPVDVEHGRGHGPQGSGGFEAEGPRTQRRLVVEDVRPAWPAVHLGELVLTTAPGPSAPSSLSLSTPSSSPVTTRDQHLSVPLSLPSLPLPLHRPPAITVPPLPLPLAPLSLPSLPHTRAQRTALVPSAPYSRSRRFLS